jgi:hypothetical protein
VTKELQVHVHAKIRELLLLVLSLILSSKEINLDELTYDHTDRKRILELPARKDMIHDSNKRG